MTQSELVVKVNAMNDQVVTIGKEVAAVKQSLADAIANGNQVTPELQAAIDNLAASLQVVNDTVA